MIVLGLKLLKACRRKSDSNPYVNFCHVVGLGATRATWAGFGWRIPCSINFQRRFKNNQILAKETTSCVNGIFQVAITSFEKLFSEMYLPTKGRLRNISTLARHQRRPKKQFQRRNLYKSLQFEKTWVITPYPLIRRSQERSFDFLNSENQSKLKELNLVT